jgi:hypothetical protein
VIGHINSRRTPDDGLLWLFRADMEYVERVRKFVCHLQPPFSPRLKFPVDAMDRFASGDRRFLPCGVFIRQFFAHRINARTFMVDVKKYLGIRRGPHVWPLLGDTNVALKSSALGDRKVFPRFRALA